MINNETAKLFDNAYKKAELASRNIDDCIDDFKDLHNMSNALNVSKYQLQCFNTILKDLYDMKGFIKAFEFHMENRDKFKKVD